MNKKAGAFAIGMVLTMIVLMSLTLHAISKSNQAVEKTFSLKNLTSLYLEADRISFYFKEASRLSAYQAFYEIVKDAAINTSNKLCFSQTYENKEIIIWDKSCKPEINFLKEKFLLEYKKNIDKYAKRYPKDIKFEIESWMENNKISSRLKVKLNAKNERYNISYSFVKVFYTNLTSESIVLEDFLEIYEKVNKAKKENKGNIENCFGLSFERWKCKAKKIDDSYLFELETKKPYFFELDGKEHFENIKLVFLLKQG